MAPMAPPCIRACHEPRDRGATVARGAPTGAAGGWRTGAARLADRLGAVTAAPSIIFTLKGRNSVVMSTVPCGVAPSTPSLY